MTTRQGEKLSDEASVRRTVPQDAQKGQASHPPNPGGYFTHPPRVCQDSLFAQRRTLSQARPQ